jgi:hypothetical protein
MAWDTTSVTKLLAARTPIKDFTDPDIIEKELEAFLSCRSETCRKAELVRRERCRRTS